MTTKLVGAPKKYTSKRGWVAVDSVQKKLNFLAKLRMGLSVLAVVASDVDSREIQELIIGRRRAGNDKDDIDLWAYVYLHICLGNLGIDDGAARRIELHVIKNAHEKLKSR